MPVLHAPASATHELEHARFTSLATPRLGTSETSVWKVRLLPHGQAAKHSVTREEIFVVLSGHARVTWESHHEDAGVGDTIVVPKNVSFALGCADDAPVELLCCLPVGGKAQMADGPVFTPPWAE